MRGVINIEAVLFGKKYRRPTIEERIANINKNNLFDYGTHATIFRNAYGKYEYTNIIS